MPERRRGAFLSAAVFVIALAAHVILGAVTAGRVHAATYTLSLGVGALAAIALTSRWRPQVPDTASLAQARPSLRAALPSLIGGIALFASVYLVSANRYSDAPSGSEVVFMTSAAWGMLLVAGGFLDRKDRPAASQLWGALLALVGAAAVLASWERPSSFSPFVKFPVEEAFMLLAGVAWAMWSRLDHSRREESTSPHAGWIAPGVFLLCAAAAVALAPDARAAFESVPIGPLVAAGGVFGVLVVSWRRTTEDWGVTRAASLFFVIPAVLSALTFVESVVGVRGPRPLVAAPVLWGALVAVCGALVVGSATRENLERPSGSGQGIRDAWSTIALAGGLAGLALAMLSLVSPALEAAAAGELADGSAFAVTWSLYGWETAGAWLAFAVALAPLVISRAVRRGATMALAAVAVASALAYPALASIPLTTLNRWIPAEVQQDYGTEYASISFGAARSLLSPVAIALSIVAIAVTVSRREDTPVQEEGEPDGS